MTVEAGPTAFLGLSHLGIVYSVGWASFGQPTVALDRDAATVGRLTAGDPPIQEPGLPELLERARPHLAYSTDFARLGACPLVAVARDVPTDDANRSDLGPVLQLADAAVPHLRDGVTLVVMSQVPPGFTRALGERVRAARPDLCFGLYSWVETLVFGDAVRRCLRPERIIVGAADPAAPMPAVLAEGLAHFDSPILPMTYESAELTKTAINLYLVGSVTYANTLADLCEAVGADWSEMVPALQLDARIGPAAYLRPSLGVAGGNLERDLQTLRALCRERDVDATYLDALIGYNQRRLDWVERRLRDLVLDRLATPTIGIWGLAYKKDTDSTKNSPALRLIERVREGTTGERVRIRAWDPAVGRGAAPATVEVAEARDDVLDEADCLLIMADWDHFGAADVGAIRARMRRPLVIDSVGVLGSRRRELAEAGVEYVGMGHRPETARRSL